VTLLHPRTDPALVHAEHVAALIRQARRLRRRRWTVGILVAVVVGTGLGWAVAAGTPGPSVPSTRVLRHHLIGRDFGPGLPEGPYAKLTVAGPLAVGPGGVLYVTDVNREQVLARLADGRFRVVAGNGKKGVSGDGGPAVDAEFLDIEDMAVGPDGSLYLVDGHRVRAVRPNGVISTVAGIPGMNARFCCVGTDLPPPIANGAPARSVSIDQLNSAAIALSEQGVLYISTGLQLLRLDAGKLDVIVTRAIGPPYNEQPLDNLGQIAVDAQGNVDVSGGNGWAIWQVAPSGVATEIAPPNARRSGGNTSVLERAPDGLVYGESGPTFLRLQGNGAIPSYSFPDTQKSYFWLTYFAFGPGGEIYADEIPGESAFEQYQQLRVVRDGQSSVLWQQTSSDAAPRRSDSIP
jgi:hypothetical protein